MSNWFYVGLAYGVTYLALIGYTVQLIRRRTRAQAALRSEPHRKGN